MRLGCVVSGVFGKGVLTGLAAVSVFLSLNHQAHAGGFAIREQSAEFQGSSFAGNAAGVAGLSSMFWNPATITLYEGLKGDYNAAIIIPYSRDRSVATAIPGVGTDTGNIGRTAVVPASYTSYQMSDSLWLGLGISAPFGMKTRNDPASVTAFAGYKSEIFTANINPVVAYRFNDMLSVAAGLQINYMEGDLSTLNVLSRSLSSRVKGDDWGVGFTLGMMLSPLEGTRIGISYRSRVKHTLKGSLYLGAPVNVTGRASVKHTLPDVLTVSLRQRISDRLDLLATYEWTNWSLFKTFTVVSNLPGTPVVVPYNWKDSHFVSAGAEYAWSDTLTLRAGYAYEKSPVPDATRGVRVPDIDRHWISVGATWKANDWITFHAGYSHLFVKKGRVVTPAFIANYKQHVNIVAFSATVDTGLLFSSLGRR